MKRKYVVILFFCLFLSVFLLGCKKKISSEKEFTAWINDEENGCVITKKINGVTLSVYYLPNEYITVKNQRSIFRNSKTSFDSLLNSNKYNLNFLMVFQTTKATEKNDDVMYKGITNLEEYSQRIMTLNFEMEQKVVLKTKTAEYRPVLSSLENTYGLSKDIKVNLVFSPTSSKEELLNAEKFDFVYEDELFGIGTVHCVFERKEIENKLPEFQVQ